MNFGRQFPITTSTPVTIGVILNGSQLDARSLIQAERNEKALKKRIQKKMMRARSTLDWSQSNNISCFAFLSPHSACPSVLCWSLTGNKRTG